MPSIDTFLLLLYVSIAISSLYAAWKCYVADAILFEHRVWERSSNMSKTLLWLQISFLLFLSFVMIAFLWIFLSHRIIQ